VNLENAMNWKNLWLVLVAVGALAGPTKGSEQTRGSLAARVDKLFAEWDKTNSPGFGLAVSRNGTPLYEHGYGMANLELGVPITSASVFPTASISKQFTAMSILLLVEQGKLSLDDEVKKLIPEWAYTEQQITIRHLLNHTSGLRDAFTLIGIAAPREDGISVNDTIAAALARQRGLNFAPGTNFEYNNGAYNLLGTIVKRVRGQSLRDFAQSNIFQPLGMAQTHFHDDPAMLVPHRVTGYSRGKSGFKLARAEAGIVGNAGLYSTARDLLRWEQNFADARVGRRPLLAEMQKPLVATGWGEESFYGFGLISEKYRGLRMVGHGGGDEGISTYVARFPDQGLAIVVLGNVDNADAIGLIRGVADIYLTNSFLVSSTTNGGAAATKVSLSREELASKAGLYRDPSTELVGRFFVRNGKLMASMDSGEEHSFELAPLDTNRFTIPGTAVMVEFLAASNAQPEQVRVTGDGPRPKFSQRLPPFTARSPDLRAFAGEYRSPEIETTYTLTTRGSDLVVQPPGRSRMILQPVFQDAFAGSGPKTIKFSRDPHGVVTGFTLYTSGVRGLRFDRVTR
jgi:CubicO group peptidase (beta-lactamase class C family)